MFNSKPQNLLEIFNTLNSNASPWNPSSPLEQVQETSLSTSSTVESLASRNLPISPQTTTIGSTSFEEIDLFSNRLVNDGLLIRNADDNTFTVNTRILTGSLRADRFGFTDINNLDNQQTIVSGNGNVDFGLGSRDVINLSTISMSAATINLASNTSGVVFNPGNGSRVFDSISFGNGQEILFEGIDQIQFADGVINLSVLPNDPLFNAQWNLHMMGVHNAWRFTTGSANVAIGIEDTGLTMNLNGLSHPEIGPTFNLGNQVMDDGTTNHGTSVQGIIAARSNNGIGMTGINWNSTVLNIDTLQQNPGDLSIAEGAQIMINQARSAGQRLVINMSLGVPNSFGVNYDRDLEQVVQNNPDVLFVIAAGNFGDRGLSGLSSPGVLAQFYSNVIAVGAVWGTQDYFGQVTTPGDRINYPGWWGSQYGDGLTVVGPSEVIAPIATFGGGQVEFGYTTKFNGTSAATPNVAGVASLVLSANPNLSATQVRDIIAQTAVDVGARGYDAFTGSGVVNADAAVRRAIAIGLGNA